MSRYVESGMLDAGITGKDWTMENQSDIVVVSDLVYSKVSNRPTRWVIAVAGDSDIKTIDDLDGKKVATPSATYTCLQCGEKKNMALVVCNDVGSSFFCNISCSHKHSLQVVMDHDSDGLRHRSK